MRRLEPLIRLVACGTVTLALAACGTDGADRAEKSAAPSATASPTASATPKPPERLCTELVGYWAERELNGDSGYGDYQSRGLSDSQNNILLDVVADAKAEREKHGERAALRFAEREAERRCVQLYEDGGPTSPSHGWPA